MYCLYHFYHSFKFSFIFSTENINFAGFLALLICSKYIKLHILVKSGFKTSIHLDLTLVL